MSLSELIEAAREQMQEVLDDNDFLSDPGSEIHQIADALTPTNTGTLANIVREEPEIAFAEPELAEPGASPARLITLAVFERLEQELWAMYQESREDGPERWRLRHEGAGGFLNPPGHPEHSFSIETEGGCASLQYVVDNPSHFPAGAVGAARSKLSAWEAGEPDGDWVAQVLGYFRNCYRPTDGSSGASDLIIPNNLRISTLEELDGLTVIEAKDTEDDVYHVDPMQNVDRHAGVAYIRKFYPGFVPTQDDFDRARWGRKTDA